MLLHIECALCVVWNDEAQQSKKTKHRINSISVLVFIPHSHIIMTYKILGIRAWNALHSTISFEFVCFPRHLRHHRRAARREACCLHYFLLLFQFVLSAHCTHSKRLEEKRECAEQSSISLAAAAAVVLMFL